jgi:ketosteroid isomerase-like protein
MSERNVELQSRLLKAYNARDLEGFLALCDPTIEFVSAFAAVGGGVFHGHDGLRSWWQGDVDRVWGESRLQPEAYFDLGEQTLVFYSVHGRGRHSGAEVAMPVALVTRWRDGLAVHAKAYAHREDALRDLGVSADELEPIAP